MSHWNWPGILFVVLVFPVTGLTLRALSWWANRGVVAGTVEDATAHNLGRWVPPASNAIDSSNYRPPMHEHVFDMERSQISLAENGSAIATCAYQGCEVRRVFEAGPIRRERTR
jgi:hypothetical protein